MSNLIKASMIHYGESFKTIDMNSRSEDFRQLYVSAVEEEQAQEQLLLEGGEASEFEPGIVAEKVFLNGDEAEEAHADSEKAINELNTEIAELTSELENLRNEAAVILDDASEKAAGITAAAKAEAEETKEQLINEYMQQGYEAGMANAQDEIRAMEQQLQMQIAENEEKFEKQVEELEPAFVEVLIKYLQKLTGVYASERRELILYLIHTAVSKQSPDRSFLIKVSSEDYPIAAANKEDILAELPADSSLEVIEDKLLSKGSCLIETESRVFDCSLDTQLQGLINDLRLLTGVFEQ